VSGGVGTVASVTAMVHRAAAGWAAGGPRITLAVQDPEGELIGFVESNRDHAHFVGHDPGDANVSYGLYPAARGKGYASRAVVLMEGYLRGRGVRRAVIRVAAGNERSIALARRLGYVADGSAVNEDGTTHLLFKKEITARTE
jgi:RimJ/RimL family protein N-acetyltransferase